MHRLTFLGDPFTILIEEVRKYFPFVGVVEVLMAKDKSELFHYITDSELVTRQLETPEEKSIAQAFRNKYSIAQWFTLSELPFRKGSNETKQFQIGDEAEHDILSIPLLNKLDQKHDLCFIQVGKFSHLFQHQSERPYLGPREKQIVAKALSSFVYKTLEDISRNNLIYNKINSDKKSLRSHFQDLIIEKNQAAKKLIENRLDYTHKALQFLQLEYGLDIKISEDALTVIKQMNIDLKGIERRIRNAVETAVNEGQGNHIYLDQTYFITQTDEEPMDNTPAPLQGMGNRLKKGYLLLEKYEAAARQLKNKGLKIIGRHIGEACDPGITNAAITDSLKKHQTQIIELLDRFPEQWPIIRVEFKSIKNLQSAVDPK